MSDGKMTYEDWLRGCIYHDGRSGYVTLPCDEVLKIADFIESLRAGRKTEPNCSEKPNNCETCRHWWVSKEVCLLDDCKYEPMTEPTRSILERVDKDTNVRSKDCETCKYNKLAWFSEVCDGCSKANSNYEPKDEPNDCDTCRYAGECDWKMWQKCYAAKGEPQTVRSNLESFRVDEPQTMYYPQVDGITPSVIEPQTEEAFPCDGCKWENEKWDSDNFAEHCDGCCKSDSHYEPKTEPLTCDGNCWMKKQNGEWLCEHCQRKPKTEPHHSGEVTEMVEPQTGRRE